MEVTGNDPQLLSKQSIDQQIRDIQQKMASLSLRKQQLIKERTGLEEDIKQIRLSYDKELKIIEQIRIKFQAEL